MRTVHLGDNRRSQFDLKEVPIGKLVRVRTGASTWYFCRVEGSKLDSHGRITNMMIMTDSRTWGQQLHGPLETAASSVIRVGSPVDIKIGDNHVGATGDVVSVEFAS